MTVRANFDVTPEMKVELYLDAVKRGEIKDNPPMTAEEALKYFTDEPTKESKE